MATTDNLAITLVEQSQSQKEVTVNEALVALDALVNTGIIDKDLTTPPGSPASGDLYIVAATATGAWAGQENNIAWYNQVWKFITPNEGITLWVNDEDLSYSWDGSAWVQSNSASLGDLTDVVLTAPTTFHILQHDGTQFVNSLNLDNLARLGINTTADTTNKLAINTSAILCNHDGSSINFKINKNLSGDTASFIFQQGFSFHAEFGLLGNNNFGIKVGSSFILALEIDETTGNVKFFKNIEVQGFTGGGEPLELTIAAGVVTATKSNHIIDTEADAATDDLDTINGGQNGDHLYLSIADSTRSVVFKDDTGNLKLAGDFTANHVTDMLHLQKRGGEWYEISRSNNA